MLAAAGTARVLPSEGKKTLRKLLFLSLPDYNRSFSGCLFVIWMYQFQGSKCVGVFFVFYLNS